MSSRTDDCRVVLVSQSLHGNAEITKQVPTVGDLNGIGCALSYPVSICTRTITGNDLDTRMLLQPSTNRRGLTVRQQIDDVVTLEVDQNRAVAVTASPGPIINSENARSRFSRLRAKAGG